MRFVTFIRKLKPRRFVWSGNAGRRVRHRCGVLFRQRRFRSEELCQLDNRTNPYQRFWCSYKQMYLTFPLAAKTWLLTWSCLHVQKTSVWGLSPMGCGLSKNKDVSDVYLLVSEFGKWLPYCHLVSLHCPTNLTILWLIGGYIQEWERPSRPSIPTSFWTVW